jgi:hypothetical protein
VIDWGILAAMASPRRDLSDPAFMKGASDGPPPARRRDPLPASVLLVGAFLRYGLAALLAAFGAVELLGASGPVLVAQTPVFSWLSGHAGSMDAAKIAGAVELSAGILVAARPIAAWLCATGSFIAIAIFVATLAGLVTRPDAFVAVPGFPVPVPSAIGAFLMKDIVLLGAALWSFTEAARRR